MVWLRGLSREFGAAVAFVVLAGCTAAPDEHRDFLVDVLGERFVLRLTDPTAIQEAVAVVQGNETRSLFPIGPLRRGAGGFNTPWSWHMDPDEVRLTEVAIEVCDGMPSYVERNLEEFLRSEIGYCPWSARIVAER